MYSLVLPPCPVVPRDPGGLFLFGIALFAPELHSHSVTRTFTDDPNRFLGEVL
jgi:hypothetical protein